MGFISYKQAAEILNIKDVNVRNAAMDGRLTKCKTDLPGTYLLREQVEIFKGKPRISTHALSPDEMALWARYKKIAEEGVQQEPVSSSTAQVEREVPQGTNFTMPQLKEMLSIAKITGFQVAVFYQNV